MNTKFDQFISEMSKSEGFTTTDIIRSIRQDLTKCSSNLDNLADRYERTSQDALAIRGAMMKVDEARRILFNLQD
jgi:hypothetical protein